MLLSITRLDSGKNLPAVLDAQWRLIDRRGQVRDNRIVHLEQPHSGSTADQVKAQGQLLQQLSEQLAVALKPLANQPPLVEMRKPETKAAPKQSAEKPRIPMAAPIRTDMEVFRF